jgi:translation initiation factor RLI1
MCPNYLVGNSKDLLSPCPVYNKQTCMSILTLTKAMCISERTICRYMFDEPSSYLDIKQRLKAAQVIRSLLTPDCYVVAVEHDLSVLDYLSDFICCLYGKPSAYGVVTMPSSVREGSIF